MQKQDAQRESHLLKLGFSQVVKTSPDDAIEMKRALNDAEKGNSHLS